MNLLERRVVRARYELVAAEEELKSSIALTRRYIADFRAYIADPYPWRSPTENESTLLFRALLLRSWRKHTTRDREIVRGARERLAEAERDLLTAPEGRPARRRCTLTRFGRATLEASPARLETLEKSRTCSP